MSKRDVARGALAAPWRNRSGTLTPKSESQVL